MDVLRKELQTVFHRHEFRLSALDEGDIEACRRFIGASTAISQGCAILSDLATNGSYFAIGRLVDILGLHGEVPEEELIDIDEDFIYRRIHPEDLVDKRMLELQQQAHRRKCCSGDTGILVPDRLRPRYR